MLIKSITLKNFKSIGKKSQIIELKPITLLFGANSVGKSTILTSLLYLHEILEHGNANPGQLARLPDRNFGGFYSLVNNHDLEKTISIRVEFDSEDSPLEQYETYADYLDVATTLSMPDLAGDSDSVAVEFDISWSDSNHAAYVNKYSVSLNNEWTGILSAAPGANSAFIEDLNFNHPLLLPTDHGGWLADQGDEEPKEGEAVSEFNQCLMELSPAKLPDEEYKNNKYFIPIPFLGFAGALPVLGEKLACNLKCEQIDTSKQHFDQEIIVKVLSQLFVSPLDKLKKFLGETLYIGPLREIPSRTYKPEASPRTDRWVSGIAAWDALYQQDEDFVQKVSHWFSATEKFNTGYEIERTSYRELADSHPLMVALQLGRDELASAEWIKEQLDTLREYEKIIIHDMNNNIELSPHDIGVGVSQILPVIVAALFAKKGIVAVEQPELHIHPAWQVELGDLFLTQSKLNNIQFLIETHSEHLLLRIMKRIRETRNNALPPSAPEASQDDISIVFIEEVDGETVIQNMPLNEAGDLVKSWPGGFFEEALNESL